VSVSEEPRLRESLLEILAEQGFAHPDRWLDFAAAHDFRRVPAERLTECPDCGSPRFQRLGQYVYYSNLVTLRECAGCALVYADTRLPPGVVKAHSEGAY
jgi:rubredoxin